MRFPYFSLLVLPLLGGCATFGSNIAGDFACRAGSKASATECPPARMIDAKAIADLSDDETFVPKAVRKAALPGDTRRTDERILRVVIPAHVDAEGLLREEAVVWIVAEPPEWAARLRRPERSVSKSALRTVARHVLDAQADPAVGTLPSATDSSDQSRKTDIASPFDDVPFFPLASPLALPSTAREAVAGATPPAVEGFDMASPFHVRTPRSPDQAPLVYPDAGAIDAAKAKKEPQ
ncbi:MAG: conjugal transfer protein TraV [Sphingomonadaceae bacterium]|nr:conjugal transfer protein TraV [Sphingomonadaceae bacterium]